MAEAGATIGLAASEIFLEAAEKDGRIQSGAYVTHPSHPTKEFFAFSNSIQLGVDDPHSVTVQTPQSVRYLSPAYLSTAQVLVPTTKKFSLRLMKFLLLLHLVRSSMFPNLPTMHRNAVFDTIEP